MSKVSRQRRHQRAKQAAGVCVTCSLPRDPNSAKHCRVHAIAHREQMRKATGSKPWSQGKPGRPIKVR